MSRAEDIFQKLIYFGEDAIDEYIMNLQTEELFLDFKQAVSIGKNGTALHKDDRKNLAKCISEILKAAWLSGAWNVHAIWKSGMSPKQKLKLKMFIAF